LDGVLQQVPEDRLEHLVRLYVHGGHLLLLDADSSLRIRVSYVRYLSDQYPLERDVLALPFGISQQMLQVLRDRGGRASTNVLATRATDPKHPEEEVDNDQIIYRFNRHLNPLGYVKIAARLERSGGTRGECLFQITESGRDFLDRHTERIQKAVDAATATERLRETRRTVDRFDGRLDSTEEDVAQLRDALTEVEERLDDAEGNVDRTHNDLERRRSRLEERLDERITGVEDDLSTLREDVNNMAEHVKTHREWIKRLQATIEGFREQVGALSERMETTESELSELRQAIRDSPLGRLF
jgi:predicted  nucleic acid-binding Zn-ribbon protein